jgi:hypothetical protein
MMNFLKAQVVITAAGQCIASKRKSIISAMVIDLPFISIIFPLIIA